ncbi:Transducin/WD40 repeat-like superfamily protein [Prunus dulcis]|uniref:Transducin/WD40 repeat-like superfamily protein n=1 Tax=Prunus dulcis TaxID=3755 RepID=A0A4Y1RQ72_PRUDU|nr:Transducin/WD40 repeat-like superfamily protein [Prunus dulcis]
MISPGLKTYFKTPEGRYKLHYEKTHPSGLLHYAHGKTVTQVTLAHLKDKPAPSTPTAPSSSFSTGSGVRSAAARLLGGGNGSRALSFVGGNGGSKSVSASSRVGSLVASSSSSSTSTSNFDGKGTYLIFNVGDAIFISDLNSQDKDPVKSIHFSNSNPVCHAFDQDAKDGHDLIIGLNSGDVYSVSLRQQLQDVGKKLVGAQHYNKDGSSKDGAGDSSFPVIKDQAQFSVAHARYSKSNQLPDGISATVIYAFLTTQKSNLYVAAKVTTVSGVAFDSYWSSPNSDGMGETVMYRFGSVGQDTQLLLWDLEMDEIVVPLRRCPPGGSPTYSAGSQSSHWDNALPVGTLQPAPIMRDVPKISPLVAHRVHTEPLSGLMFTQESVLTVCREGHIKVWMRPGVSESQSNNSETVLSTSLKEKPLSSGKSSLLDSSRNKVSYG